MIKYATINYMNREKPISIGLCTQIMIDTIGQDCLLDFLNEHDLARNVTSQKQRFERLKKKESFDSTTIKNLDDFAKFLTEWGKWLETDGFSSGMILNYVDRFLCQFSLAAKLEVPVGNILYVLSYSICYVMWETLLFLFQNNTEQSQSDLIRSTISIFDYFDSDSKYTRTIPIFKKVFFFLDKIITNKAKLLEELSQWISKQEIEEEKSHELERQIDRWIKGEQCPSWKYVKYICSEGFLPSKELFKRCDVLTDKENEPIELWKGFRRIFLLAYFINNLFNSLENKHKLITKEQKEYVVSGIRYFFKVSCYPNDISESYEQLSEKNFVFHSLYHTFISNMPESGLKEYLEEFIPWLMQTNPAVKFGIAQVFETEAEAFKENNNE